MKQSDFKKCACCGAGMAATGLHFYRVRIEQMILNTRAIQRQHGLELMVGNAAIAQVMGPNDNLAEPVATAEVLICGQCGITPQVPHMLLEEEDAA